MRPSLSCGSLWFWSDRYDRKIQMASRIGPDYEMHVATGNLTERRFVAVYGRAGRSVGVLGFNRSSQATPHRMLIESNISLEDAIAAAF